MRVFEAPIPDIPAPMTMTSKVLVSMAVVGLVRNNKYKVDDLLKIGSETKI